MAAMLIARRSDAHVGGTYEEGCCERGSRRDEAEPDLIALADLPLAR
jgi:hypothetical protein